MKLRVKSEKKKSQETTRKHHLLGCNSQIFSAVPAIALFKTRFPLRLTLPLFLTSILVILLLRNLLCNPAEESTAELMSYYRALLFQRSLSQHTLCQKSFKPVLEKQLQLQYGCFAHSYCKRCFSDTLLAGTFSLCVCILCLSGTLLMM